MASEIWKDIKGFEGKYQVSTLGRVKSLVDNKGNVREKIRKPRTCNSTDACKGKRHTAGGYIWQYKTT